MKIVTPVIIVPEPGETVWEVAKEIAQAIQSGKIAEQMVLLELPFDENYPEESGKTIKVKGNTAENIRDSIATHTKRTNF